MEWLLIFMMIILISCICWYSKITKEYIADLKKHIETEREYSRKLEKVFEEMLGIDLHGEKE